MGHVAWLLELAVKEGELANVKALMKEMVDATQVNEPGALHYEWSLSDDGKQVHLYERYTDSDAVMTHLGTFGERFADRFLGSMDVNRLTVYGEPNDEVKQALSGLGAVFMNDIVGFTR